MKNIRFVFVFFILCCVSTTSLAKKISAVGYNDVRVTINPDYGWIYSKVNMIMCTPSSATSSNLEKISIIYSGKEIGHCYNAFFPSDGGVSLPVDITSGPVKVTLRSYNADGNSTSIAVYAYDYISKGNSNNMGSSTVTVKDMTSVSANVADSVTFADLKSDTLASKPLLLPATDTPGRITVKPSLSEDGKGIIQDRGKDFSVPYTIDGGEWSEKDGGWVITSKEQSEPHNIIINPDKIKLHPGNYSGYVTVEVAAE